MDEIKNLESLGLVLPSPLYIAGAILFGIVGLVAFRRGRKSTSKALTWTGVALMLKPGCCGCWVPACVALFLSNGSSQ